MAFWLRSYMAALLFLCLWKLMNLVERIALKEFWFLAFNCPRGVVGVVTVEVQGDLRCVVGFEREQKLLKDA